MGDKEPIAQDAGLQNGTKVYLVLQERVPEGYSASQRDHNWHDKQPLNEYSMDVSNLMFGPAMRRAEELLDTAPQRNDTIYRVISREVSKLERLIV